MQDTIYEQIKTSDLPLFICGTGALSAYVSDRLSENDVAVAGYCITDERFRRENETGSYPPTIDELSELYDRIDLVMGYGRYDKKDELLSHGIVNNVFIIANPYPQYQEISRSYLDENKARIEKMSSILCDSLSYQALHDFYVVQQTADIDVLMKPEYSFNTKFDFGLFPIEKNENYVDIGAFTGDTIQQFITCVGGSYQSITAFEPDENNYNKLQKNTRNLHNVHIYQIGLGREECELSIDNDNIGTPSSRLTEKKEGHADKIHITTVDKTLMGQPVTLMKIGVPIWGYDIIQGGRKFLVEQRPNLIISAIGCGDRGTKILDTIETLNLIGYQVYCRFTFPIATQLQIVARK